MKKKIIQFASSLKEWLRAILSGKYNYYMLLTRLLAIAFVGCLIWLSVIIRKYKRVNQNLIDQLEIVTNRDPEVKTETLRIYKTFTLPQQYKYKENPEKVLVYNMPDTTPKIDSLISLEIKNKQLNISILTDSTVQKKLYALDLNRYEYNYSNGELTFKRVKNWKLRPYIGGNYQFFHNITELSAGVLFETNKLNYKLGGNCYYHPKTVKADLEFGITYKFF